jgi:glycosyltransferase involved in cell wall biosynthesis
MHPAAGGPAVVVKGLCALSPREGWDAAVITTSLYCGDDGESLFSALSQHIDLMILPLRGPHIFKYAPGAVEAINKAVREADVVHLHTLWNPLNAIARKACQRFGRKYVLMPHGMLDPYALKQSRWRKEIYFAAIERRNLQAAFRLIFTSAHEQHCAQQRFPWLPPGEVIPLAADCASAISREQGIAVFTGLFPEVTSRRCLLFLGRIHPKKGLERLLKLLPEVSRNHPDVLLVIAGSGEKPYVGRIKRLVRASKLESHVLFTGALTGQAKFGAFACARAFLLPSKQENFGIAVAEAMHMAVPVIISDKVDSWPFVRTANAGFVVEEAHIEAGFAQRVDEILKNPGMAKNLGKQGQGYARKHFTWQRVAKDMASLYEKALKD